MGASTKNVHHALQILALGGGGGGGMLLVWVFFSWSMANYGQSIICFYMMGLGANFTKREVAYSANSCANCHYDIYQDILVLKANSFYRY